jgi:hypothetical protein
MRIPVDNFPQRNHPGQIAESVIPQLSSRDQ